MGEEGEIRRKEEMVEEMWGSLGGGGGEDVLMGRMCRGGMNK